PPRCQPPPASPAPAPAAAGDPPPSPPAAPSATSSQKADLPSRPSPKPEGESASLRGHLLSTINVTGPSLTRSTCISAPKRPVAVGIPSALVALINASYSGTAISGRAASTKDGPRPLPPS